MNKQQSTARPSPPTLDIFLARTIRKAKHYSGTLKPFTVLPFRSYGFGDSIVLAGRVIENLELEAAGKSDPWWRNLTGMIRVFLRARAENAVVRASVNGQSYLLPSDAIGYFEKPLKLAKPLEHNGWIDVDYTLEPMAGYPTIAGQTGRLLNIAASHGDAPGIISDIDDTVIETYATDLLMSARMTFAKNFTTRMAIPGMAELYTSIAGQGNALSPVFYITSSSWSLYSLLSDFLKLRRFPEGPLLMQKIGLTNNKLVRRGHGHKTLKIESIFAMTRQLKFYLFGDNGQADEQIYHDIASRYPDRVLAVCIRTATDKQRDVGHDYERLGIPYFAFSDGFSLRRQLAEAGLLCRS